MKHQSCVAWPDFNTGRSRASEGQWNSPHINPQERWKDRGRDIPLEVWCLYSPCFSLYIAYLCLSWSWRNGMATSLLLLLPMGFSFLPLLLKYLQVLLFGLGPLWLLGRCSSALYCWMVRHSFIHSVLFTHQAVKFLLTFKEDDDD